MKRDILNMKEFIEIITIQDNKKTKESTEGLFKYKNIKRQGEKSNRNIVQIDQCTQPIGFQ